MHHHIRCALWPSRFAHQQGVEPGHQRYARLAVRASGHRGQPLWRNVEVDHLAARVYTRVRAASYCQGNRLPDERLQCFRQHTFHRSQARLSRPSMELSSVIGQIETDAVQMRYGQTHERSVPYRWLYPKAPHASG